MTKCNGERWTTLHKCITKFLFLSFVLQCDLERRISKITTLFIPLFYYGKCIKIWTKQSESLFNEQIFFPGSNHFHLASCVSFFFVSKFSSVHISISRCLIFYAIQKKNCLLVINSWYYLLVVGINCKLFTMSLFIWFNVHSTFFFSLLSLHLTSLLLLHLSNFTTSLKIPIFVSHDFNSYSCCFQRINNFKC
jgi:hypothetical protein